MRLDSLTPILNVSNLRASLAWFEALGWERGFVRGGDGPGSAEPDFASVQAGEAEIFLCLDGQGARGVWMSWFLPGRAELGDVQAGIDDAVCDLRKLFEWVEREEAEGTGEAPYPPNFPKMPGEPKRVQPSRAKKG